MNKYTDEFLDTVYDKSIVPYFNYIVQWYNYNAQALDKKRAVFEIGRTLNQISKPYHKKRIQDLNLIHTVKATIRTKDQPFKKGIFDENQYDLWTFIGDNYKITTVITDRCTQYILGELTDLSLQRKVFDYIKMLAKRRWNTKITYYLDNLYNIQKKKEVYLFRPDSSLL